MLLAACNIAIISEHSARHAHLTLTSKNKWHEFPVNVKLSANTKISKFSFF